MNEKKELLLALDGGTGSFRAILFNEKGRQVALNQVAWTHPTNPRYQGSVDFDFKKDWELIRQCIKELLASGGFEPADIRGISVASFREGFVLYDENKQELMAFSNVDARAQEEVVFLKENYLHLESEIYQKTGQTFALSAVPRLLWVKNHEPEIYQKIKYFNMLNDWLIFKLTGRIVSEPSNSSTSGFFDLEKRQWLREVADECQLKSDIFPKVLESGEKVGNISPEAAQQTGLSEKSLVICGGGDSQLGCIGLGCIKAGQAALFGGSFWQYEYNTRLAQIDAAGHLRVNCHAVPKTWQYEAIAWNVGFVMRWFKAAFLDADEKEAKAQGLSVYQFMDEKAKDIPAGSYGMIDTFADVMHFENLKHAAPTFTNFKMDATKYNKYTFYRSIMENAGLITLGHLKLVEGVTGKKPKEVFFAGGSSYSSLWSQIVCDILGLPLIVPKEKEATALGTAFLAGVGCGLYQSLDEAVAHVIVEKVYQPDMRKHEVYEEVFEKWQKVYQAQLKLADEGITDYMWIAAGAK